MSVREYVGARYVPLFAEPLTWDATRTYEPLTVVLYQGNSYTSRQAVPANIEITNTTYWAQTGNYNAQIEQYRAEVQTFDSRIEANANAISDEETARQNADSALQSAIGDEATARQNADSALQTAINNEATARQTAINSEATARQAAIDNEALARQNADTQLQTEIDRIKPKQVNAREWWYVDCIDGDDNNDGTTEQTPFKTLAKWVSLQNEGYDDIRVRIMRSGTYTFGDEVITAKAMHIVAMDAATNVVIQNPRYVFYGTRLNCAGATNGTITFENYPSTETEFYGDLAYFSITRCHFTMPFGCAGGMANLIACTFDKALRLNYGFFTLAQCALNYNTGTKITSQASHIIMGVGGGMTWRAPSQDLTNADEMFFRNSIIFIGQSYGNAPAHKYNHTIEAQGCFIAMNPTQYTAFRNGSLNDILLTESILNPDSGRNTVSALPALT